MARPTTEKYKKIHFKIDESLIRQVAEIFEKDANLSKLSLRDDASRLRTLITEFIRSDGKNIQWNIGVIYGRK